MSRAWRIVLYLVLGLLAAGIVLLGAAWITGASIGRIEELALGGKGGLQLWLQNGADAVRSFLANAWELVRGIF